MKSYSQFSESLNDLYLKEWEKLDEDTQKEIIEQFAEENNIQLDEEPLSLSAALATSPAWLPPLAKAAAWTTGILGTTWAAKKHLKNREERKNLETFFQSKELPKSSRTDAQELDYLVQMNWDKSKLKENQQELYQ